MIHVSIESVDISVLFFNLVFVGYVLCVCFFLCKFFFNLPICTFKSLQKSKIEFDSEF